MRIRLLVSRYATLTTALTDPLKTPPLSTRHQLELMRQLQRLATARAEQEQQLAAERDEQLAEAQQQSTDERLRIENEYATSRVEIEKRYAEETARLTTAYETERNAAQQVYHGLRNEAESDRRRTKEEARKLAEEQAWEILTVFDAQKPGPKQRQEETVAKLKSQLDELAVLEAEAALILKMRRIPEPNVEAAESYIEPTTGDDVELALGKVGEQLATVRHSAQQLYGQKLPRLLEGAMPAGLLIGGGIGGVVAGGLATGWSVIATSGAAVGALAAAGGLLGLVVRPKATRQAGDGYAEVLAKAREARTAIQQAGDVVSARRVREAQELIERRDADLAQLGFTVDQQMGEMKLRVTETLEQAGEVFPAKLAEMRERHSAAMSEEESRLTSQLAQVTRQRDVALADVDHQQTNQQEKITADYQQAWQAMRDEWFANYQTVADEIAAMRAVCDERFPDWRTTSYAAWNPPTEASLAVEFGRTVLDLAKVKAGLSSDERLHPPQTKLELPALVTLADQPSLILSAEGAGRQRATEMLQAMALRWLTGQPPGKVRLTVLDPIGLGEGFSSLMHLADFDENLIAGRIWSEARDIDEQLLRLTTHLETVIQKYLRSEYETIHQYNAQAGEVAEPFQLLVINGFPTNFSDAACRRLVNLATSGARCGLYIMMAVDRTQRAPTDFQLDDLLTDAVFLDWERAKEKFIWRYPAYEHLPLTLAQPPDDEQMVEVIRAAGQAAKDAVRVEVPFTVVAPEGLDADGEELWSGDCSDELRVPIGRAGANRLQDVRLGKGTSQHLLVAGKTGSGKSTFLHALVTSAALRFSPDEVEFYLVDFKKGVEFKSYATHRLPHARVVAIESEREFGLSVLERLDDELRRRGELYRAAGVQNLADYRREHPSEKMPRLLLVIDEFQELFVEDDKLSQDATLMLDRLVRQGRAFGIHVLLGTQTLAGAFSIARSTLGQIAIRVALACSEADAHLILSDERNQAARFLSRPGEAIYNDQNGLISANEPFQVVWLPDRERTEWLAKVDQKRIAAGRDLMPTVVFEGNAAADQATNQELTKRLTSQKQKPLAGPSEGPSEPSKAFLGDAVAIKPPTAATFGRHGGSNLLVVGSQEPSAMGVLSTAAVSLAAGEPQAKLTIIDATRPGEAMTGAWQKIADALPASAKVIDNSGAASAVNEIAAEVARREAASEHNAPPIYLVLHNAGRLRDLRRTEDDFSFSIDKDKPASPDKQLAAILRDGPGLGVHVLAWCDSYNAVTRLFERATMREFALRVVLQMSAADSSNLIDTPAASDLRQHRALFYNDETGEAEKFRPYGPPADEWLAQVGSAGRTGG